MYYKLNSNLALRKWKYVDRAIYAKGVESAFPVAKEDFDILLLCDGEHDLEESERINRLVKTKYIEKCDKDDKVSDWSRFKEYDNYYFPKINLMITGKCNLNCLHCFNAKDNDRLNTEWKYEDILKLLDESKELGVHAFTITGGEPLVHKDFLNIIKAIYERDMFVFELNTNGILITQNMLDEFKKIGCYPLIKISFDGVGYHNWMRQNPKAEEKTIEAIKLCIINGFKVKVQTQVHKKNVDVMMDTAKLLNSLGVYEMRIIRTTEVPRWEQNSSDSSLPINEYYDKMLEFAKEYINSGYQTLVDIWQFIRIYPKTKSYSIVPIACKKNDFNTRIPMCKGNRGMIAISSSGEVVPCMQMSGYLMEKGISIANAHSNTLKEIINNSEYTNYAMATLFSQIIRNNKCSNCKYYKACTGGCPALGLLYAKEDFNYYHEDITKCYFFENDYYTKIIKKLSKWNLLNPLDI